MKELRTRPQARPWRHDARGARRLDWGALDSGRLECAWVCVLCACQAGGPARIQCTMVECQCDRTWDRTDRTFFILISFLESWTVRGAQLTLNSAPTVRAYARLTVLECIGSHAALVSGAASALFWQKEKRRHGPARLLPRRRPSPVRVTGADCGLVCGRDTGANRAHTQLHKWALTCRMR